MKAYRFRLEVLLRIRRAEEELAREALVLANRRLMAALARRDEHADRYRSLTPELGPVSREDFFAERLTAELAAATLRAAQEELSTAGGEVAMAQATWTQARRAVRVLERLDERRRAEHSAEEQRQEAIEIDDIVTAGRGRLAAAIGSGR